MFAMTSAKTTDVERLLEKHLEEHDAAFRALAGCPSKKCNHKPLTDGEKEIEAMIYASSEALEGTW